MISLILIFFARGFKALSDTIRGTWSSSIFSFLSKESKLYKWSHFSNSWKNKWKLDQQGNIIPNSKKLWYYGFLYAPSYIERFPYSSTFLVSLTDLWHLSERLRRLLYSLAFAFIYINPKGIPYILGFLGYSNFLIFINVLIWVTFFQLVGFTTFFDYILNKKTWLNLKTYLRKKKF